MFGNTEVSSCVASLSFSTDGLRVIRPRHGRSQRSGHHSDSSTSSRHSTEVVVECLHNEAYCTFPSRVPGRNARPTYPPHLAGWTHSWPRNRQAHTAHLRRITPGRDRLVVSGSHRLEARGWIAASWELSNKGKRARFYRLTRLGRKQLVAERSKWEAFSRAMAMILNPADRET